MDQGTTTKEISTGIRDRLLAAAGFAEPVAGGWMVRCPTAECRREWAGADVGYLAVWQRPLFVADGPDGAVHVQCQAGCRGNDLYPALMSVGVPAADVFDHIEVLPMERTTDRPARQLIPEAEVDAYLDAEEERIARYTARKAALKLGTLADDVEPEVVIWLWPGRIPAGKLTLPDGDPGLGKSLMVLDVGARVTRGDKMPDGAPGVGPAGVIYIGNEEGYADTVVPRLVAAGADLQQVLFMGMVKTVGGEDRPFNIGADLAALRLAVKGMQARLVIIDPLMAHLPTETNSFKDQDVRRALAPLAKLAEETGVAVVMIRHLSKSHGGNAIYAGGGSIGFGGVARSVLLVAKDRTDDSRRVLAAVKNNLCPTPPSLLYQVVSATVQAKAGPVATARVEWLGITDQTANSLVAEPKSEDWTARDDAVAFLREVLTDGPVPSTVVEERAAAEGIKKATLRRAQAALGVKSKKLGMGGPWVMRLPEDAHPAEDAQVCLE